MQFQCTRQPALTDGDAISALFSNSSPKRVWSYSYMAWWRPVTSTHSPACFKRCVLSSDLKVGYRLSQLRIELGKLFHELATTWGPVRNPPTPINALSSVVALHNMRSARRGHVNGDDPSSAKMVNFKHLPKPRLWINWFDIWLWW